MSLFRSLICLCSTEGSTDCLETKGGLRNDRYKLLRRLKGCVRRIRSKAIRPTLYYLRYSSLPAPFLALAVPVTRSATSESSGIFLHFSISPSLFLSVEPQTRDLEWLNTPRPTHFTYVSGIIILAMWTSPIFIASCHPIELHQLLHSPSILFW